MVGLSRAVLSFEIIAQLTPPRHSTILRYVAKYWDDLDELAVALAAPGRRQIVDRLRAGPAPTSELAELLGIGLPAVTKHLALLRRAGLMRSSKSGRVVTHRLDPEPLLKYSTWLSTRESFWHGQIDALNAHLERR